MCSHVVDAPVPVNEAVPNPRGAPGLRRVVVDVLPCLPVAVAVRRAARRGEVGAPGVEDSLRFKNFFRHWAKEGMSDLVSKFIWTVIRIICGYNKLF